MGVSFQEKSHMLILLFIGSNPFLSVGSWLGRRVLNVFTVSGIWPPCYELGGISFGLLLSCIWVRAPLVSYF